MRRIKPGDLVEYQSLSKKRKAKVLIVKKNGDLILDTRKQGLIKNVCVKPTRVKVIPFPK